MISPMIVTRSTVGLPSTILLAMVLEYMQTGKVNFTMGELQFYTAHEDEKVSKAMDTLAKLQYITVKTVNREKVGCLTELLQIQMPINLLPANSDSECHLTDLSGSHLSSSSNLTLINKELITTTTLTSLPDLSGRQPKQDDHQPLFDDGGTEQVKRILEATPILFGEPGVFTKGLHLNAIYPQVALGWVKQGWNAKNLEPCKRAGVVYNGLKSGENPKEKFLFDGDDNLPHDYLVAIGHAQKTCDLCGEKFSSLDEFEIHWKSCVTTHRPEADDSESVEIQKFEHNPLLDDKRAGEISINEAWASLLNRLQLEMPRAPFDTWVRDTVPYSWVENKKSLQVVARNLYAKDWLSNRMIDTIKRLLDDILGEGVAVEFVVVNQK